MGLQLNPGKCEVISHPDTVITDPYLSSFVSICVAVTTLLGASLFHGSMLDDTWSDRCAELTRAVGRLSLLNVQVKHPVVASKLANSTKWSGYQTGALACTSRLFGLGGKYLGPSDTYLVVGCLPF